MNTLLDELRLAAGEDLRVTADTLFVELSDGRTITAPLAWFPRLQHERSHWRFIGRGEGIHWPDLDEDISVEGLVLGKPSGETSRPLRAGWKNAGSVQKGSAGVPPTALARNRGRQKSQDQFHVIARTQRLNGRDDFRRLGFHLWPAVR